MPDKEGIPETLRRQLIAHGSAFRRLEDGIVVFQHPEHWLLMQQFSYTRVVSVSLDAYANRTSSLQHLFETGTPVTLP